ncbi:hypothetical protein LIP55_09525 [[Ruminococcus] gnavus]|nr:hypothetical protein [Mediterraneibacter gnavus]
MRAFDQSEKEVQDLHQRIREGIETTRLNGKQIGQKKGKMLKVKKKVKNKKRFGKIEIFRWSDE